MEVAELKGNRSELSMVADDGKVQRLSELLSTVTVDGKLEKQCEVLKVTDDEKLELEAELLLLELHAGVGFNRKAGRDGADFLIRDEEKWGMVRKACPNLVAVRRETGKGSLAAILSFQGKDSVMNALVSLWDLRLKGVHRLTPQLGMCSSDTGRKIDEKLRGVFVAHMLELCDGRLVKERLEHAKNLSQKIKQTTSKSKKFRGVDEFNNLKAVLKDLSFQHEQTLLKISEFKSAVNSISRSVTGLAHDMDSGANAFVLGPNLGWCRLHSILERECERLQAQLPLYGRRSDIVSAIYANQVTVLVGETGSGKSTQLVQYLADVGYSGCGKSVVCTQPRKVAAMTLAERVTEESEGCLQSSSAVGCVISSGSSQSRTHWAEITFTTDFVLLQHCLTDPLLTKFSCVVVDEAHERSLNTDLLLALLKSCIAKRPDLRVVIMSATADANLLSSYFDVGEVLRVPGRNFPVQILYEPEKPADVWKSGEEEETEYARRVVGKVRAVHEKDKQGTILAFLTSPSEVDWACRQEGFGSSALVLPFYGKLPHDELQRVFQQNSRGKRKIVFSTNFAETSLTIPDVRFVVDCGLAKDSAFDPQTGMNVLNVKKIDQSSAIQRAGRAGRTQAGVCYRLYSSDDFEEMASHRLPEIKRVHLGLAILKLLALGIKEPHNFDFVEAPDLQTILLALRGLDQIRAVRQTASGEHFLTSLGWKLVRLNIDPRLGKLLLDSINQGYGQDGLVIAALMSNSRSVFYRSGSEEMKGRADCLKMRFCHPHGDVFTLLSVYQEWDSIPERCRNKWCVMNSISAKALRKCRDQVYELKACLKYELNLNVPSRWGWSPKAPVENSIPLRKIIFSSMAANLAVFSGHARVGYDVISVEKQTAYLHPSSAVLVYGTMPKFVVFGEVFHTSSTFLVLVTVVDPDWITSLSPSIGYDVGFLEQSIMRKWAVQMASSSLLARVTGQQGRKLELLISKIQERHKQRCIIDYSYENNTFLVYTTSAQMPEAERLVCKCIERERRRMNNECIEKSLVEDSCKQIDSPNLLFGAGGLIRDVVMPGEYAAVEVMYESCSILDELDDEELLELFDQCGEGISGHEKLSTGPVSERVGHPRDGKHHQWGIIRFCSRIAAEVAVELLNGATVSKSVLQLKPFFASSVKNCNRPPFPAVKATLAWARRRRKGRAVVTCSPEDADLVLCTGQGREICGTFVSVKPEWGRANAIFLFGLDRNVDEKTLQDALFDLYGCRALDVFMPRYSPPLLQPSAAEVLQMLTHEITPFVPVDKFHVKVFAPSEKDYVARAEIGFEDSAHEGGTLALAHLEGLSLPGWEPWQKITHQRVFSAQVHCSRLVFAVVKDDLVDLIAALQQQHPGSKISFHSEFRFHRIRIKGTSLGVAAGCKSAIEKLMEGQVVISDSLGESAIWLLSTKKGAHLSKAVEGQTQTLVMYDKRTRVAKIYGPKEKKVAALDKLLDGLAKLHSDIKCRQVVLRGEGLPAGLMREIVKLYGPDLCGLRELAGVGASINVDNREHLLLVEGGDMDGVMKVQAAVADVAQLLGSHGKLSTMADSLAPWSGGSITADNECSICFCPREDQYYLEGCGHGFCRSCLIDQLNSSIRHREGFPLTCAHTGCSQIFLLSDIHMLLTVEQQEGLQSASLSVFVAQSHGRYRFCTTPDCPNVYQVTAKGRSFICAACSVQLCTACHVEYHEDLSCAEYREFKLDPDASLHAWRKGKKDVKNCPGCSSVIEKVDGCNHMTCKCGKHVCWVCLSTFGDPSTCYDHLRKLHGGIDGEFIREGIE